MDDLRISTLRSVVAALMAGGIILFNRIAVDWALQPLRRAVAAAAAQNAGSAFDINAGPLAAAPREIQPLLEGLAGLYKKYAVAEGDIRVGKIARQVAHDIRSPLAALEMGSTSKNVPEAERIILRQATNRVRDIANDLTGRFREVPAVVSGQSTGPAPELLPVLIDEIVTEMRLRYRQRNGLEITANLDASNYGLFAAVDPAKFHRTLSNLIQNAVEAIPENGTVRVQSEVQGEKVAIAIIDDGQGIPKEILPRLGVCGETYGRKNGSGLGLFSAKEDLESWGGGLTIESEEGRGTTIRIELPLSAAPEWFVPRLEFPERGLIVVLDDDQSIHQIWTERLSAWTENGALQVSHFTSAAELRQWFISNKQIARGAQYLVDFELIGEKETGLSLIEELGIRGAFDSHYESIRRGRGQDTLRAQSGSPHSERARGICAYQFSVATHRSRPH